MNFQKPSPLEIQVCQALISAKIKKDEYDYYGDEFYPFARKQTPFFKEIQIQPADLSKMKKKDKIIYENCVRLIEENLHSRKNIFNMNISLKFFKINSQII